MKLSDKLTKACIKAEARASMQFAHFDAISLSCTERILNAFAKHRVSDSYFAGTTGYGYDDVGRDKLELIFADVMGGERALVRTTIVNGTHAIACGLFAVGTPGKTVVAITGGVYDTLKTTVGLKGALGGTFADYGIGYKEVPLKDGMPDNAAITTAVSQPDVNAVFIQRSRGYGIRQTLSCAEIGKLCTLVHSINPDIHIVVDNCYGEFCEESEPLSHGADLICGSLIKNPGGGIAPAGGYIAGKAELVERAASRMTVPGIGGECGASLGVNRLLYQGFFMAPHTTAQALKTAAFCAGIMEELGFSVSPTADEVRHDIIQTISFGNPEPLLAFCRGIQAGAPVDAYAVPQPWETPGYDCPVIMAAGAFVQGSSIELSCDAPMRPPFTAYMQGGLTYESGKLGVLRAANMLEELL